MKRIAIIGICLYVILMLEIIVIVSANEYYVSIDGSDNNSGLTEEKAWQTITYATIQAEAGDIVHIKGGNYGDEHIKISNKGTGNKPTIFEGYKGQPSIEGVDRLGDGIYIHASYIVLRNIGVKNYQYGIRIEDSKNITLDNINANNFGNGNYDGWGINLDHSDYCDIQNCHVYDSIAANYQLDNSDYNIIENCTAHSTDKKRPTNYYIYIRSSHNNIIRDCVTKNEHQEFNVHPGHGIGFKDKSYDNKVINCSTYNHGEYLYAALGSHDNQFLDCRAYNYSLTPKIQWNEGLVVRDGAYRNYFVRCDTVNVLDAVAIHNTADSAEDTVQYDNEFYKCNLNAKEFLIYLVNAENNSITNCLLTGANSLYYEENGRNNVLEDSTIQNVSDRGAGDLIIKGSIFK